MVDSTTKEGVGWEKRKEDTMRLSGAELAVMRHIIGLTLDELAEELGVNPRTVRSWEQEREPIPVPVRAEMTELIEQHQRDTRRMLASQDDTITLPRTKYDADPGTTKGWLVAVAARAFESNTALKFSWFRRERS